VITTASVVDAMYESVRFVVAAIEVVAFVVVADAVKLSA